mmetsp:Transcript_26124/g.26528  ORF Transcript_26124/g.26528 Transcript_26124/m.26528 type:complete len:142 (+) Transcript_26124:514-939(+)
MSKKNEVGGLQLTLPLSRIKKIARLDSEVKGMSREALLLIARSAELFTTKLGLETVRVAQMQNRRKILPEDISDACTTREEFFFLREDLRDLLNDQQLEKKKNAATSTSLTSKSNAKSVKASEGSKPLTSYFSRTLPQINK